MMNCQNMICVELSGTKTSFPRTNYNNCFKFVYEKRSVWLIFGWTEMIIRNKSWPVDTIEK